jgi:hypothetical protein
MVHAWAFETTHTSAISSNALAIAGEATCKPAKGLCTLRQNQSLLDHSPLRAVFVVARRCGPAALLAGGIHHVW